MNRRTLRDAAVGLGYIVVIGALIWLSIAIYNRDFTTYTDVALKTGNVGSSLHDGSDVKVRGVIVGDVKDVTTDGDGAVIHLELTPAQAAQLPANVTAQLLPKTFFGERYVNLLEPPPALRDSKRLSSGATIYQDTTPATVELEKLFGDLLPVLEAVQPQKLSATLGELAEALRGPAGDDLNQLVTTVGKYLNQLGPEIPHLNDDLQAFAQVVNTYSTAAPDLVDALDALSTTSTTLVNQQRDFTSLLSSLTSLGQTFGSFMRENQSQIIGLSIDSLPTLKTFADYSSEYPCLARALTDYIPIADQAFGAGTKQPGAHVILHVVPRVGPYTAADTPTTSSSSSGPRCPYTSTTGLAATALAGVPGIPQATTPGASGRAAIPTGLGITNSPQENQLIAELLAPTAGLSPQQYPKWASLLLGPALRGTEVTLK